MKRILLILLLLIALPFVSVVQAQIENPETRLIISEFRTIRFGRERTQYMELCNLADTAVNLSNFEVGMLDDLDSKANELRRILLPDILLEPDSTFLIAHVSDYNDNFGDPYQGTQVDIKKKIDLAVYADEDLPGAQDGKDSIHSVYPDFFGAGAYNKGWYLEYQENGEGVFVDAVHNAEDIRDMPQRAIAGIPDAWTNYLLVRKSNVSQGNTNWDNARGNSPEDSEWLVIPYRNSLREGDGGVFAPYFTTIKHHGDQTLNNESVSSLNIDIDWENETMTVPWGIYTDYIMENFEMEGGIAWHYNSSMEMEDLAHNIAVTGDTLRLYAVGNQLEQIDFTIEQAAPSDDMNMVFPKNRSVYDLEEDEYSWPTPYYVTPLALERYTQNFHEMDSIGDIGFATRVDTLFKYLEKPSNASWEIDWVDGEERVDLKRGDILRVTAENGDSKDYYLDVDSVPAKSTNAYLSAITWPDAPEHVMQNPAWKHDTIPDFSGTRLSYQIKVPYGSANVPALVATPQDLNAQIDVDRAVALSGPAEDRTTTFTVTAEDDTTVVQYNVIFRVDKPNELIQKFEPHPIITKVVYRHRGRNNYLRVTNPGNQPLDLSDYMIGLGNGGMTPADVIQRPLNDFNDRYYNYIPGYDYQSEIEWQAQPGLVKKDIEVEPNIAPGESFIFGKVDQPNDNRRAGIRDCNVIFNELRTEEELADESVPLEYRLKEGTKVFSVETSFMTQGPWMAGPIILFKIKNDSIKAGTKPIGDPNDFEVIDVFGDYVGDGWSPGTDTLPDVDNKWDIERKPEYWENDSLPGVLGSWAETDEESEWNSWSDDYYSSVGGDQDNMVATLGYHSMDPVFVYISTISSFAYIVSDGYTSPQNIRGIKNGTTVEDFFANLNKSHEDQTLTVKDKNPDDMIADGDTLKVISADSVNITKYVISLGELSSNAVLTSNLYNIKIESEPKSTGDDENAGKGYVSGFDYGTQLGTIINNIIVPDGATMNIVDEDDALIPFRRLNFDTTYVNTSVNNNTYLDVVAEDGLTRIIYQLLPDVSENAAFILSDVYKVSQGQNLVSYVPRGTNVKTLMSNIIPSGGATLKLIDKIGNERTVGTIKADDKIVVTSPNGLKTRVYHLSMLATQSIPETTYLAYVLSDVYTIDQVNYIIEGPTGSTLLTEFNSNITPSMGATTVVIDKDGNEKTSDDLDDGDILKVTSVDGKIEVIYELQLDLTSVDNLAARQIKIYPNPSSEHIFIEGMKGNGVIVIKDIFGSNVKMVNNKNIHNARVSIQDLASGIYFIYLQTENYRSNVVKIVKQ